MPLDELTATRIAETAVERAGGARYVYATPRHPFAPNGVRTMDVDGYSVTVRFSEASSPAIVEVEDFVFEIRPEGLIKLFGP